MMTNEERAKEITARALKAAGMEVDPSWLLSLCCEQGKRGRKTLLMGRAGDSDSYLITIATIGAGDQSTYCVADIEHSTRGTLWRYGAQEAAR